MSGAEKRTIELNTVEAAGLADFAMRHAGCSAGDWPARMTVDSVSTGICDSLTVTCKACGASENFSDHDSW